MFLKLLKKLEHFFQLIIFVIFFLKIGYNKSGYGFKFNVIGIAKQVLRQIRYEK